MRGPSGDPYYFTFFKLGFSLFAEAEACLVEFARIALAT